MDEKILVIKTELIKPYICGINGLITKSIDEITSLIENNYEFIYRSKAENDPSYKQIIPYVVLIRENEVFTTRRLNKGGEERLHGLLSIGIGGHINPVDTEPGESMLMQGLRREVEEEVYIEESKKLSPIGIINDDSNAVGSVHLGFLFTLNVQGNVEVRETEKLKGAWMTREQIKSEGNMETWTEIALKAI
ncbi:MAG: NUDIX domain-containing protein [Ruminococcaceae bacterium]|nr:NUDIX domain-containing protein [Oscillospiraceae bacterium]